MPLARIELGRGRVLGRFGRERAQPAGRLDIAAAIEQGLALREAEPDRVGGVLPARLIGVEEGAFDLRPESLRMAADRRRRHHAGVRPPARQQPLQVVARQQHVAVGHHDPGRCAAARQPLSTLLSFGLALMRSSPISSRAGTADARRSARAPAAHRIARGRRAEQDLVARIVEREGRAQRRLDEIVEAAYRADDA